MTISTALSEIKSPQKKSSQIQNFRRHMFQVHNQDNNSLSAIALIRCIFEIASHNHHANFVTFFVVA
jgi:hypothetical protein